MREWQPDVRRYWCYLSQTRGPGTSQTWLGAMTGPGWQPLSLQPVWLCNNAAVKQSFKLKKLCQYQPATVRLQPLYNCCNKNTIFNWNKTIRLPSVCQEIMNNKLVNSNKKIYCERFTENFNLSFIQSMNIKLSFIQIILILLMLYIKQEALSILVNMKWNIFPNTSWYLSILHCNV